MQTYEVEIKARCGDPEEVRGRLEALEAELVEERFDEDIYYSHPCRDFGQTDEAFRVRKIGASTWLTYKGPKLRGTSKTRVEEEVAVGDAATAKRLVEALGFSRVLDIRKNRILYRLNDIEICIDSVEDLGDFVELEIRSGEIDAAEEKLFALAATLGLDEFERRSYLELLLFPESEGE